MGAMARQVLHVKRKNSTNCNSPEARLTVAGSVAYRSGPREVATGTDAVGDASVETMPSVGASSAGIAVSVGRATLAGSVATAGGLAVSAGAQAATRRANRLSLKRVEGMR
jgi:hypothetical protein